MYALKVLYWHLCFHKNPLTSTVQHLQFTFFLIVEKKVLHIRGLYQTILICKDPKDFRCVHQLKKV